MLNTITGIILKIVFPKKTREPIIHKLISKIRGKNIPQPTPVLTNI